jgi:inorganic phosphate transporter, PiT family
MHSVSLVLVLVVVLALVFDFINGFHDTANSIATSVSTRVLSPKQAIIMAALLDFTGALLFSKVAETISAGIVSVSIPQYVVIAALLSAITWNIITWYFGIPSSSSHALMGALVGASIAYAINFNIVKWDGLLHKVVIPLVTSPIIGFILGFSFMKLLFFLLKPFSQRFVNKWFSKFQIVSAATMALSHGMNDAQKSMGIITLALISAGFWQQGHGIPLWVKIICAIAIACGVSIGGWKIIKTMGVNMIRLQPINGFAAETSAAAVILFSTVTGNPVSTTHIISSSIMGVGASKRVSAVRWALARSIVWAWVLTIPITCLLGAIISTIFKLFA